MRNHITADYDLIMQMGTPSIETRDAAGGMAAAASDNAKRVRVVTGRGANHVIEPSDPLAKIGPEAMSARGVMRHRCGTMVVSLDFELYWGVRHRSWAKSYKQNLIGARAAIPAILEIFKEYNVHATWAAVGFLFCASNQQLLAVAPSRRPDYVDRRLVAYDDLPSDSEHDSPDSIFFAPSLIRTIAESPNQEIATHSFSHYYCLEEGAEVGSFIADLHSARRAAALLDLEVRTLVFPKNQERSEFIRACSDAGISAYRANPTSWLYRAAPDADQTIIRRLTRLMDAYLPLTGDNCSDWVLATDHLPVGVRASRYLRPYSRLLRFCEPIRIARIKRSLTAAATKGRIYHLWWHPHDFGRNFLRNIRALREILDHHQMLKTAYGMKSLNIAEVADVCTRLRISRESCASELEELQEQGFATQIQANQGGMS